MLQSAEEKNGVSVKEIKKKKEKERKRKKKKTRLLLLLTKEDEVGSTRQFYSRGKENRETRERKKTEKQQTTNSSFADMLAALQ